MMQRLLVIMLVAFSQAAVQLPPGIEMCKKTDDAVAFNECARDVIERFKPYLANGVPSMNIPPMEPLFFSNVVAKRKIGILDLDSSYKDFTVKGITNFTIVDFNVDPDNLHISLKARIPILYVSGQYKVAGKLFSVPLGGHGTFKGVAHSLDVHVEAQGKDVVDKSGEQRVEVDNFKLNFDIEKASLKLKSPLLYYAITYAMEKVFNFQSNVILKVAKPLIDDVSSEFMQNYVINKAISSFTKNELIPS